MSAQRFVITMVASLAGLVASATTYTWDVSVAEGAWTDPSCWTAKNGYPSTSDTAVFPAAMNARVTLSGDVAVSKLTLQGGTSVIAGTEGATLKIQNNLEASNNTTIEFTDGLVLTVPQFRFRNGSNKHLTLSNGATAFVTECNLDNGSEFTIDNARLETTGNNWLPYGAANITCTIRFKGKNPVWFNRATSSATWGVGTTCTGSTANYVFEVPVGGFAEAPIQSVLTPPNSWGGGSTVPSGSAMTISIPSDAPVFQGEASFDQPLVSWPTKGINTAVVIAGTTSEKPGNLIAVTSTGVSAHIESHFGAGTILVSGSPLELADGGEPAYGPTFGHVIGETVTLRAPAEIAVPNGTANCVGWAVSVFDDENRVWSEPTEGTDATCSFTYSGAYTRVTWKWARFLTVPSEDVTVYHRLAYVDNNQARYFDTDYYPVGSTTFGMGADFLSQSAGQNLAMGTWNGGLNWRTGWKDGAREDTGTFFYTVDDSGQGVVRSAAQPGTTLTSCYLGALHHKTNGAEALSDLRIRYAWFADADGIIRRDYVAASAADGTLGLYDTVNGRLNTGIGTGALTAGPRAGVSYSLVAGFETGDTLTYAAPADYVDAEGHAGRASAWRYLVNGVSVAEGLGESATVTYAGVGSIEWTYYSDTKRDGIVEAYREIDYLESTRGGLQWIDTGYVPNGKTTCEVRYCIMESIGENVVLGIWNDTVNWRVRPGKESSGFSNRADGDWTVATSTVKPEGETVSCYIFGQNYKGSGIQQNNTAMRIAACRFCEDGEPVVDLVPVIRLRDNKVGFFDRTRRIFLTNCGSTTPFVAGPLTKKMFVDVRRPAVGSRLVLTSPVAGGEEEDTRWTVTGWTYESDSGETSGGAGTTATIDITEPGNLDWNYEMDFLVKAETDGHGAVLPAEQWVREGLSASFTVTPDGGFVFYKLTDGVTEFEEPSLVVTKPLALTVVFTTLQTLEPAEDDASARIQAAIDASLPNGIVQLAGGDYALAAGLVVTNGVRLRGAGIGATVLTGPESRTFAACTLSGEGVALRDLTISHFKQGVVVTKGSVIDCKFVDCALTGNNAAGGGVSLKDGWVSGCLFENCHVNGYYTKGGGLFMSGGVVSNCTFRGCYTWNHDYGGGGAWVEGGLFTNNRILSCGGGRYDAKYCGLYVKKGTVRNTLVADSVWTSINKTPAVKIENGLVENCTFAGNLPEMTDHEAVTLAGGTLRNCIVWGNGGTGDLVVTDGTVEYCCYPEATEGANGNTAKDPLFRKDYRIRASSPCRNAGLNQDWMTDATDLIGNPRILNAAVDMGCYEVSPSGLVIVFQ